MLPCINSMERHLENMTRAAFVSTRVLSWAKMLKVLLRVAIGVFKKIFSRHTLKASEENAWCCSLVCQFQ
jgi:hypothetical protein